MTINEIQSTLDQLKKRHPDLNDGLIQILLEAGGWDMYSIKEAQMLFRSQSLGGVFPHEDMVFLPESPELLLKSHNEEEKVDSKDVKEEKAEIKEVTDSTYEALKKKMLPEKESLVLEERVTTTSLENPIPHNLPLKPFEESPHIWQFSKYKDVFYGDTPELEKPKKVEPKLVKIEEVPAQKTVEIESIALQAPTTPAKPDTPPMPEIPKIELTKVPLTKNDEGIVAGGSMLLLVIILLIIYMYNQGRI